MIPLIGRYTHLYGEENRSDVLDHLDYLMNSHPHEDIRVKARMLHNVIGSVLKNNTTKTSDNFEEEGEEQQEDDLK